MGNLTTFLSVTKLYHEVNPSRSYSFAFNCISLHKCAESYKTTIPSITLPISVQEARPGSDYPINLVLDRISLIGIFSFTHCICYKIYFRFINYFILGLIQRARALCTEWFSTVLWSSLLYYWWMYFLRPSDSSPS